MFEEPWNSDDYAQMDFITVNDRWTTVVTDCEIKVHAFQDSDHAMPETETSIEAIVSALHGENHFKDIIADCEKSQKESLMVKPKEI